LSASAASSAFGTVSARGLGHGDQRVVVADEDLVDEPVSLGLLGLMK
jgi:hypothetical protein